MSELSRRLGTVDAVVIGLGSMMGAGVFAAFGPAARAAGASLLIGLAIAAAVAYCNAVASAQLAAQYPTSGGTYVYGRERLGPWWGFLAGWGFVVGKSASCAAMALTVASYTVGAHGPLVQRLVAVAAVVTLTALNYRGITKTALLARILLACTLIALTAVVFAIAVARPEPSPLGSAPPTVYGVLQSAGLLFFAFAGYARIATMGEEVRDPARTIPRAITVSLAIAVAIYLVVGVAALLAAGPDRLPPPPGPPGDHRCAGDRGGDLSGCRGGRAAGRRAGPARPRHCPTGRSGARGRRRTTGATRHGRRPAGQHGRATGADPPGPGH